MEKIQAPKGTRDFYPPEMRRRRYLEDVWRRVSLRAGFEEVDGPIFESLDLYVQKSGQEIVEQLYNFEDKGGRPLAIRPEFTPTLARMVAARQATLPRPVKWFNISRVCRYERSQKGRLREFFQWNCDIIGADGPTGDAECIAVATDALREFGLTPEQVEVRLSSRRLLAALMRATGLADETIPQVYAVLDKRSKVPPEVFDKMFTELHVTPEQREAIDAIFRIKGLDDLPPALAADVGVAEAAGQVRELLDLVAAYGAAPFVRFDISIVRGLAYYTGPVWEVFDKGGELRSLFGGGRYDNLIATLGGQPMAACGFGAGDVTMSLLLDNLKLWPKESGRTEFFVVYAEPSFVPQTVGVVKALRAAGRSAQYLLNPAGLNRQMKAAAESGASFAVIVGVAGVAAGQVRRRNLATGQEQDLPLAEIGKA